MSSASPISVTFGRAEYAGASELEAVVVTPVAARIAVLWRAEELGGSERAPLTEEYAIHTTRVDAKGDAIVRCVLPVVPVTYQGTLFRVVWLVQVRCEGEGEPQEFPFVVA